MPRDREAEAWLANVKRAVKAADPGDLVERHLLLAVKLAGQYRGRGVSYADLLGEANLALVEAARDYPQSRAKAAGIPFGQYAARSIRNSLLDAVRRAALVNINTEAWLTMSRASQSDETAEGIAQTTGGLFSAETVRYLRQLASAMQSTLSWDEPVREFSHGGQLTLAEVTEDPSVDVEGEVLDREERRRLREELTEMIEKLPKGARTAVSLRFGLPAPSLETLSLVEVLKVAVREDHGVYNGLHRIRKVVGNGEGLAGRTVVSHDRKVAVFAPYSPFRVGRAARILRDKDEWRRLASEQLPPAVGTGQY